MTDVLFVSRQRLVGATNGSSAYLLQLAQAVRDAGMVPHLLQPSPTLMGRWPWLRLRPEMAVFETHAIRGVMKFGRLVLSRDPSIYLEAARAVVSRLTRRLGIQAKWTQDRPRPYAVAMPWTKADCRFVSKQGRAHCAIVIADYMFQAEALACLPTPRACSAILMHDLFHSRAASSQDNKAVDSVAQVSREDEIARLSQAGAVIAIQTAEALFVEQHVPGVSVILAPIAAVLPAGPPQPGEAERILFVGSRTAPNTQGLAWFLEAVWPIVCRERPTARLDVVGSVCQDFGGVDLPGVTLHGLVDDLEPHYAQAGVVISPLLFGSGLKVKLIEALARGKAVVATDVTLQGVERECAPAIIRANTADEFARAIIALQSDHARRERLGQLARATASRHFSAETVHADFTGWLRSAASVSMPSGSKRQARAIGPVAAQQAGR